MFGTDEHDLLAWQNVCALVGIGESLETCEDCIRVSEPLCLKQSNVALMLIAAIEFEEPALQPSGPARCPSARKRSSAGLPHPGSIAGIHAEDGQSLSVSPPEGGQSLEEASSKISREHDGCVGEIYPVEGSGIPTAAYAR